MSSRALNGKNFRCGDRGDEERKFSEIKMYFRCSTEVTDANELKLLTVGDDKAAAAAVGVNQKTVPNLVAFHFERRTNKFKNNFLP